MIKKIATQYFIVFLMFSFLSIVHADPAATFLVETKDKKESALSTSNPSPYKPLSKIFINDQDFQIMLPNTDRWFNDLIQSSSPSSSILYKQLNHFEQETESVYEYNLTKNKSEMNTVKLQFLPYFKPKRGRDGQLIKEDMFTFLKLKFF